LYLLIFIDWLDYYGGGLLCNTDIKGTNYTD